MWAFDFGSVCLLSSSLFMEFVKKKKLFSSTGQIPCDLFCHHFASGCLLSSSLFMEFVLIKFLFCSTGHIPCELFVITLHLSVCCHQILFLILYNLLWKKWSNKWIKTCAEMILWLRRFRIIYKWCWFLVVEIK